MRLVAKYIEGDEIRFVNILAESIIEKRWIFIRLLRGEASRGF